MNVEYLLETGSMLVTNKDVLRQVMISDFTIVPHVHVYQL